MNSDSETEVSDYEESQEDEDEDIETLDETSNPVEKEDKGHTEKEVLAREASKEQPAFNNQRFRAGSQRNLLKKRKRLNKKATMSYYDK